MLDKNTFGKTKEEEKLTVLLNEKDNLKLTRYVCGLLSNLDRHIKNVKVVDSEVRTGEYLFKIFKNEYYTNIDKCRHLKIYKPLIKNYLKSVVKIKLKSKFYNEQT